MRTEYAFRIATLYLRGKQLYPLEHCALALAFSFRDFTHFQNDVGQHLFSHPDLFYGLALPLPHIKKIWPVGLQWWCSVWGLDPVPYGVSSVPSAMTRLSDNPVNPQSICQT